MKQRVAEMEQEALKLRELQAAAAIETPAGEDTQMDAEDDKSIADGRSIYVGNVRAVFRRLLIYSREISWCHPVHNNRHRPECFPTNHRRRVR